MIRDILIDLLVIYGAGAIVGVLILAIIGLAQLLT